MILKFKPILLEKVWGGTKLGQLYNVQSDKIGECWGISGHKSNSNILDDNGRFKGMTLRELYTTNKELFGNYKSDEFPILIKYIDAEKDLSIQVHPDDKYAKKHEKSKGKEECWFILESKKDTKIIIGNSASSKNDILESIKSGKILEKMNSYKIRTNDYFYIPSGTIHAICSDTFLLEVSQSSDITYRLYDYNRLDKGKLRDLHINKSLDVIRIPDIELIKAHQNKYFTFEVFNHKGTKAVIADQYGDYISILDGEGYLGNYPVKSGEFYMVTSKAEYIIEGNIKYHLSKLV